MAKVKFTRQDIRNHLNRGAARIEQQIIIRLQYLGEECLRIARESQGYTDQTGNLRSSIGYMIVRKGKVVFQSSFESVKGGKDGAETGRKFARERALDFGQGFTLVVVAGMPYADAVESMGKDVLSASELYAVGATPQLKEQLKRSIGLMR